jgi:hypothetical protein
MKEELMFRICLLVWLVVLAGCRDEDPLAAYLGPYYGGFDTAMTPDPGDDLNANECPAGEARERCSAAHGNPLAHLLMKLGMNAAGELTASFYRTREDYEQDRPLYLSQGCRTTLAPAREVKLHKIDEELDETQLLVTASFPLQIGNRILACTNSVRLGGRSPEMELALQVNPVTGATAVNLSLERSRRDGDYLYVKQGGEKVPVKLDLRYVGTEGDEARRLCAADGETKLENKDGYQAVCVMTGEKKWSLVLPISPWGPGVTAFWGATRSPKWYRTSGEPDVVTYHRAVFLPVQFETVEGAAVN